MARGWHTQDPAESSGQPLKGDKAFMKKFYAGARLESPLGGTLHLLRIRPNDDGSGTVLFECSVSSLRFELQVPKATRTDKTRVKEQQESGWDPHCPRHVDPSEKLIRSGDWLVCSLCGVRYGKPI